MNPPSPQGGPPPLVDRTRLEATILDELERIRLLRLRLHAEPRVARQFDDAAARGTTSPELVVSLLRTAQTALLRHPAAAAFVFAALAEEGRRYAATPEGAARAAAMAADPAMADLRRLWEATSLNTLGASPVSASTGLPEGWLDLVLDTAASVDVHAVIAQIAPEGLG